MTRSKYLSSKTKKLLNDLDWDCSDQFHLKTSLNIIHWYPASFITAIPGNIIDIFSDVGDAVWDPFCGSGSSAVEAFRKGRIFIGSDVNDISILVTTAKVNAIKHRSAYYAAYERFKGNVAILESPLKYTKFVDMHYKKGISLCNVADLNDWYSEGVLNRLITLWGIINKFTCEEDVRLIFRAAFLNIAKIACAQKKTWGHVADNVKPTLEQRLQSNNDVYKQYIRRLEQIAARLRKIYVVHKGGEYTIENGDARYYTLNRKVKLVITSPPYPSMADYTTSQRIAYYWLGYTREYISHQKIQEIGARYLRHNAKRNDIYLDNMRLAFDNIIDYVESNGVLAIMLPEYNISDERCKVIRGLYKHINNKLKFMHKITRNIDELNRWAPFRRLSSETLYIWRKI